MNLSDPTTLFLSVLLCFFVALFFYGRKRSGKYNLPPGPRPLPIIGNLHILDLKKPYQTLHQLSKKYGPTYTIKLGEEEVVVLCGYEAVKDALVNHADEFSGRPKVPLIYEITKGHGIIFAHDDNWKAMRRFTLSVLRDFGMGKETIKTRLRKKVIFWFKSSDLTMVGEQFHHTLFGEPFDNHMIINAAVANIIVSILLSHRFTYEDPTFVKLLRITDESLQLFGSPIALLYNAFPSVMRWCSTVQQKVAKNLDEMHAFIRETFTDQRKELDVNDQRNLIDSFLVKQQEENPQLYFTNENLFMLVTDLFAAGMETTSTTLRWGLLLMMKYPEIQRKVQREIENVIGLANPQVFQRKQMPYTDAVIHEIQRFGNIVPTNLPHATTQDLNFRGYLLPKGTHVIPLLTSILYDKEHFVKADEFYPEHFLDSRGNFVRKEAFIPFSVGKRSCAGENLAKMELFIFFTRLLQNFTFQAPPGATLDLTPEVGLTTGPLPYKICAISRG